MGDVQDKLEKLYNKDSKEELLLEVEDRPDVSPAGEKAAEERYGKVEFADQPNKKYPIDLKHIQAALSYFGMPKNYEKYSDVDRKTIAKKIATAAEKFGKDVTEFRKKFGV